MSVRGRGTRRRKARIGVRSRGRGRARGRARASRGLRGTGPRREGLRALPEPGAGPRLGPLPATPRRHPPLAAALALHPGGGGLRRRKAGTAPSSTRARRPPRGRGPCPGDSGTRRLMAAGSGFVGAEASSGGGWGERADAFLLHVDSSRRVGRGTPLHTGRHLGTGANRCNRQNNCDIYVINCPILYTQAVLISNCKKISFLVLIFSSRSGRPVSWSCPI